MHAIEENVCRFKILLKILNYAGFMYDILGVAIFFMILFFLICPLTSTCPFLTVAKSEFNNWDLPESLVSLTKK